MRHSVRKVLTILSGQVFSEIISDNPGEQAALGNMVDFAIHAPATLPETISVMSAGKRTSDTADLVPVEIDGVPVVCPVGVVTPVPFGSTKAICLKSDSAVGDDRVFDVVLQVDMG